MTQKRKWTARQWRYIQWCATPQDLREPKKQLEMAKALKVSVRTLQNWQKKRGFWEEVDLQVKEWVGRRTPDIIGAMLGKAIVGGKEKDGDVPAAKLVLGYSGKYEEKKGGGVNIAIIQPVMHEAMAEIRGVVNDLIALYVPEAERSNARGYLAERVRELGARVDGEVVVEDGVFRPLLQDKKQRR